ncbi:MAG: carbohydrate-binding protein, partial [Spirochaetales bacterium]|nr:carbohydrate-binding protein [Spirochaetales bacterium]
MIIKKRILYFIMFIILMLSVHLSAQTYAIPGQIEAENYSAMSGIQAEACSEGGTNVGWIEAGDWMDYPVNISAGTYTVSYRVASLSAGGGLSLQINGVTCNTINFGATGGWQTWTTVTGTATLPGGNQTIRIYASQTGWNINWFSFTSTGVSTPTPTSTLITPSPDQQDITNLGGTISAQYTDSPSGEDILKLIDNSSSTKYLTFHASGWVQYSGIAAIVSRYTFTSANDAAERDPYTWTLQGSNNGSTWTTLDSRNGEDFPNRFQVREFSFSNSTGYSYYRLNMTNNSGTILQLAEWELYGTTGTAATSTPTSTTAATATRTPTMAATATRTSTPTPTQAAGDAGLNYAYYEGSWDALPDFTSLTPVRTGTVSNFDISVRDVNDNFGFRYTGYIRIAYAGAYTFYTGSDDGSRLYIDSQLIVDNDGLHGAQERSGSVALVAGDHSITVTFFEKGGDEVLDVSYEGPYVTKQLVPGSVLYRTSSGTPNPSPVSTATPTSVPGQQDITNLGGTVSAQYNDSPGGEEIDKLLDNSSSTKYLTFHASGWVQYSGITAIVNRYTITSANDAAERDPYTWTMQGSNNGLTWITLDSRSGEDFPNRFQLREFSFNNSGSYSYYRLNMTNNSGTILQLAEWEIFGTVNSAATSTPTRTPAPTSTPV